MEITYATTMKDDTGASNLGNQLNSIAMLFRWLGWRMKLYNALLADRLALAL